MQSIVTKQDDLELNHNVGPATLRLQPLGQYGSNLVISECLAIVPKTPNTNRITEPRKDEGIPARLEFSIHMSHDYNYEPDYGTLANHVEFLLDKFGMFHKYRLPPRSDTLEKQFRSFSFIYLITNEEWDEIRKLGHPRVGDLQRYQAVQFKVDLEEYTPTQRMPDVLARLSISASGSKQVSYPQICLPYLTSITIPAKCGKRGAYLHASVEDRPKHKHFRRSASQECL